MTTAPGRRSTTWPSVRRCGVCGRERKIQRAAVDSDPDMCQACWARDPRSWLVCGRCAERRPKHGRDRETGQPICGRCYRHTLPTGICDSCDRSAKLARTGARGGPKLCGACVERERRPKRVCGRCGRLAAIAARAAADGTRDLCFGCYAHEPRRVCGGCGQPAAIRLRGRGGKPDLCQRCYRMPTARCSVCDRDQPCYYATTAAPVCWSCKPRRVAECAGCGRQQPVKARSPLGPLCGGCQWRRLRAKAICERCGQLRRPAMHRGDEVLCGQCAGVPQPRTCTACGMQDITWDRGLCPRCTLFRRLDRLRAAAPSAVAERLQPYLQTLLDSASPLSVLAWLNKPGGRTLIAILGGDVELSHDALDALQARTSEHLRAALVHAGVLPARDELLVTLEAWTTARLAVIAAGPDRATLRAFATWKVHRELAARRAQAARPDVLGATMPKHWIASAIDLAAWLHQDALTLADLDQARLDAWLARGPASRRSVRPFIAWLQRNHTDRGLRVPSNPPGDRVLALDDQQRLAALRRLLADDALPARLRVAGCLVALYAQPAARIIRLTANDLQITEDTATIRLGGDFVSLPTRLRSAAAELLDQATAHDPWLFPGRKPGQPMHPAHLARRLKGLGVPVARARPSALAALAHRIPAAVLADLLGLSAQTACKASADLKVDYANYVARRT